MRAFTLTSVDAPPALSDDLPAPAPADDEVLVRVHTWNTAERSWDCPCHGSRFAPEGDVLQGPAVRGLERKPIA